MKHFSIVLLIRHPAIDPRVISDVLKLEPYACIKAGEPKKTPKGTPLPGTWERSSWNHIFEYEVEVGFLEQLKHLLAQFRVHKDFFARIANEGGETQLYINLPGDINQGDAVDPSVLGAMAELQIHLGIEVFPEMNPRDPDGYIGANGITFIKDQLSDKKKNLRLVKGTDDEN